MGEESFIFNILIKMEFCPTWFGFVGEYAIVNETVGENRVCDTENWNDKVTTMRACVYPHIIEVKKSATNENMPGCIF